MTPLRAQQLLQLLCAPSILALLLAGNVSAQSSDNANAKVWAAVAYINHGEKTPTLGGLQNVLTPGGAQQMANQGAAFRIRYLNANGGNQNSSLANSTTAAPILNIASNAIDNSQLTILSQTDEWVTAGAMAFMQALYPPALNEFGFPGGQEMAQNVIAGTNNTNYPMGGYQYPNIQSLSSTDPSSVVIQGTVGCSNWESNVNTTEQALTGRFNATIGDYQSLFSNAPLKDVIPLSSANYWSAYDIYEYVNYMMTHNETVNSGLVDGNDTVIRLRNNAFELERAINGVNTTSTGNSASNVSSIAGQTLAKKIIDSLSSVTKTGDSKLTLMFGSFEPMIALLSLAGLYTHENLLSSSPFSTLPNPGAAMIFELIGNNADDASAMPSTGDLLIRFTYRASADDNEEFSVFPLFSSGFDGQTIPYTGFLDALQPLAKDSSEWCDACNPVSSSWCSTTSSNNGTGSNHSALKPAVAGVIGAAVTLAVVGLVGLGLFAFGVFRFGGSPDSRDRASSIGGFKGVEKKPSDTDVTVTKSGVQHERVGSWELRDDPRQPSTGSLGIVTTDLGKEVPPRRDFDDDEDGVSISGATPVKARESI